MYTVNVGGKGIGRPAYSTLEPAAHATALRSAAGLLISMLSCSFAPRAGEGGVLVHLGRQHPAPPWCQCVYYQLGLRRERM